MSSEFEGRVAIVTGAAMGIGQAVARLLAASGAKVALLDRAEADTAGMGEDALAITVELTDEAAVNDAVAQVARDTVGEVLGALGQSADAATIEAAVAARLKSQEAA